MAEETEFKASLKGKGYKLTLQRMAIYEALQDGPRHPTAEEVHAHVSIKFPMIGLSTVYNTLETLCELGLAKKVAIEGSVARYDIEMSPHAHLVCLECGKIVEFRGRSFEGCRRDVLENYGFHIIRHEATFFGHCSKCASEAESEELQ